MVKSYLKEANQKRSEADKLAKNDPINAERLRSEAKAIEAEYGIGSNLQMGVRAATAALQGLATGSVEGAAVGALSPYANRLIKEQTTNADGSTNKEANLIAHAMLGAIEAYAAGNNAAAGAAGALTAEAAAPYLMQALYNTDKAENLTDGQKQNLANLSQITAGLASGVTGDSTASGIVGAEIGKRAVEDNLLGKALNNPQADWNAVAKGQAAKQEAEKAIREYIEKEHPTIYQTAEGAYYFINQTGKAVYIARELALELAPMVIAPEVAAGSKAYTVVSRAALGAGTNVVSQKLSGQDFNAAEMAGAAVSSVVTPNLKTTKDIVRFNSGVGMGVGLASGDGLESGGYSGIAAYGSSKISNPVAAATVSEVIQKFPDNDEPKEKK